VRKTNQAEFDADPVAVYEAFAVAVEALPARIDRRDPQALTLEARTSWGWRSWGEVLVVSVQQVGPGRTRVVVTSRPKLPTQVIDFGKNTNNLNRIFSRASERLTELPARPDSPSPSNPWPPPPPLVTGGEEPPAEP
jgi:hypothetical protein